ncbi:MAG: sugar ABC transporter permease [Firmicutes bacterium]|nr:sugar ABC transporter permease [Bacillota bacterium]
MNNMKIKSKGRSHSEAGIAYLLMGPALLAMVAIVFYPVISTLLSSFFEMNKMGDWVRFVGLGNFSSLFADRTFWVVLARSVFWTVVAVSLKTLAGLGLGVLLNQDYRGRGIIRTLIVIPWAAPVPIAAMIWMWTFNSQFGLLNHFLKQMGFTPHPPAWLANPTTAFWANLTVDVWLGIPFMALAFLAGLQAISHEYYEAAQIDGANSFQRFSYITLPFLRPVILVATLLSVMWTFNDFNVIYIITKGGPMNTTDILVTYLYKTAFLFLDFSHASVMAFITFIVLLVFSLAYARLYFKEG